MGFRNGSYMTVWAVEPKENFTRLRMSSSRKNKQTGAYEQDWSGFASFVGSAKEAAAKLKEKDRIKLGDCDVTTKFDSAKRVEYTNYVVFGFEVVGGNGGGKKPEQAAEEFDGDVDEDGLPF